jgi:choline dehydrogenase-like flavoprotein
MSSPESVDVVIVGSGPAGSAYARVIGDALPHATILMVEVGPKVSDAIGEHTMNMSPEDRVAAQMLAQGPDASVQRARVAAQMLAQGPDASVQRAEVGLAPTGAAASDGPFVFAGTFLLGDGSAVDGESGLPAASMASGIGGMGTNWAGSCPRPVGAERIPFIPADELDALLDRAEGLLSVSKDLDGDDELLTLLRKTIAGEFDGDAPDAPPVGLMPMATVRRGGGFRQSGTDSILGDLATRVPGFSIRPDTLAQRILVSDGEAVGVALIDRNTRRSYEVRAQRVVVCADSLRTPQLLWASGIRPPALGRHLNDHIQMVAFASLREEFLSVEREDGAPVVIGSVLVPFIKDVRPMQGQLVALARIGIGFGDVDPELVKGIALLPWYGAKDIQASDAVTFSDTSTDFYGMPAMTIHYNLTDTDQRTISLMRQNIARCVAAVGSLLGEPTLYPGGSSLHYQGTVRMGDADDGSSVCDPYCQVWGIEGLYVGGNGVIPTATVSNPTLTTIALATRAASHLAAELSL